MQLPELLEAYVTGNIRYHNLQRSVTLHPSKMSLNLKTEDPSVCNMSLSPEEAEVIVSDWIRVYYPNGDYGIFYVRSISENKLTGERDLSLEHCLGLLRDIAIPGEWKYNHEDIGGNASGATVKQVMDWALSAGSSYQAWWWEFGRTDFASVRECWTFTNTNTFDILDTLTESVEDCMWQFDMSSLPFKLSLVKQASLTSTPSMEMRMNRNIQSMKVTIDKNGMANRVYGYGEKNLVFRTGSNNAKYVQNAESIRSWGLVSHILVDSSIRNADLLLKTCQKYLAQNKDPIVTISIDGLDLSEQTGEPLDKMRLGRVCRVPLPQYGTVVNERVMELNWPDCITRPENVTVTLANERKDIKHVLAKESKKTKKTTRAHSCDLRKPSLVNELQTGATDGVSAFSTGLIQNLWPHSHNVSVNDQTGDVILGGVTGFGGNFNIAATKFFADAVAAAKQEGKAEAPAIAKIGVVSWTVTDANTDNPKYKITTQAYDANNKVIGKNVQTIPCSSFYWNSIINSSSKPTSRTSGDVKTFYESSNNPALLGSQANVEKLVATYMPTSGPAVPTTKTMYNGGANRVTIYVYKTSKPNISTKYSRAASPRSGSAVL